MYKLTQKFIAWQIKVCSMWNKHVRIWACFKSDPKKNYVSEESEKRKGNMAQARIHRPKIWLDYCLSLRILDKGRGQRWKFSAVRSSLTHKFGKIVSNCSKLIVRLKTCFYWGTLSYYWPCCVFVIVAWAGYINVLQLCTNWHGGPFLCLSREMSLSIRVV